MKVRGESASLGKTQRRVRKSEGIREGLDLLGTEDTELLSYC